MTNRTRVLGAVAALLSVPLLLAIVEGASYYMWNRNNGSIVSSGESREYLLHVPASYDAAQPTPLVITMHGGAIWPALQRDMSRWNRVADRHGFIVVYPAGMRLGGAGPRGWRVTREGPGVVKEVRFVSDLIDELAKTHNIDQTRVYANGLSNGGGMTFVLSCTLSDRIAAIGTVASAQMLPWSWCNDPRPLPIIAFHGTADELTPYEGGTSWVGPWSFPDVSEWTMNWARRNGCEGDPIDSEIAADVTRREYTGCVDDASVVLFTVHGGGHTWPGGEPMPEWFLGPTNGNVDASDQMWTFFRAHRLSTDVE